MNPPKSTTDLLDLLGLPCLPKDAIILHSDNTNVLRVQLETYGPSRHERILVYDHDTSDGVETVCREYRVTRVFNLVKGEV